MSDTEAELRELVALAGRVLYQQGLADYLGHCSARIPGTDLVVIKPKHSTRVHSLGSLTAADMIIVDLDADQVGAGEPPPAETRLHTEIYRTRPDVGAIVHTHQLSSTLLGVIGADLLPVLHIPAVLTAGGSIATWPCPLLVTTAELGRSLAAALGDGALCHLQGHGIVSVAADVKTAIVTAVALEQLAEANLRILETGCTPRVISAAELAGLAAAAAPVDGRWSYYLQLLA